MFMFVCYVQSWPRVKLARPVKSPPFQLKGLHLIKKCIYQHLPVTVGQYLRTFFDNLPALIIVKILCFRFWIFVIRFDIQSRVRTTIKSVLSIWNANKMWKDTYNHCNVTLPTIHWLFSFFWEWECILSTPRLSTVTSN